MNHPGFVRRLQRLGDLLGNPQRLVQRDWAFGNPVGQGRPFDQLQNERLGIVGRLDAVDRGNPRMVEAGEDVGFPLEASQPIRVSREGVGEDFQGDVAPELRVGGAIDLPHAAFADEGGHVVMAKSRTDGQGHRLSGSDRRGVTRILPVAGPRLHWLHRMAIASV